MDDDSVVLDPLDENGLGVDRRAVVGQATL
jgi:hypothetical protein